MIPKTDYIYLLYAKRSKLSHWWNYGRTDDKQHAYNLAHSLYDDLLKSYPEPANCYIQLVMISRENFEKLESIPENLKPFTYWLDLHMISVINMQTNPDQTIYNGGN